MRTRQEILDMMAENIALGRKEGWDVNHINSTLLNGVLEVLLDIRDLLSAKKK